MGPPVVVEVGPAVVRRWGAAAGSPVATTALDGIDDPLVLLDERPIRVDDLLRSLLAQTLGERCSRVLLVHPSSWPAPRVARVVRAAAGSADRVVSVSRSELAGPDAVVVEIDTLVVMVRAGDSVTALRRDDVAAIAATAARCAGGDGEVVLDVPPELPGAAITAAAIRAALAHRGLTAGPAEIAIRMKAGGGSIRLRSNLIGAAALCLLVILGLVAMRPHHSVATAPVVITSTLVEGRVAVAVPDHWTVERLTQGPGSRRVQVSSPTNPDDALHITQSYAPGTTLADAGAVLGRVAAGQSAFAEFLPHDEVAGRPAVTYREDRPPRVVRWVVLLDGSTRISIGCQSRAGAEDGIRTACDQAIRSAREVQGTVAPS